jgi:hypothetical protein
MAGNRRGTALFVAATLLSSLALPGVSLAAPPRQNPTETEARAMYEGLRSQALSTTAQDIGVAAELPAYGALMEFLIDGDTVTVAAFATGDGSIYFSPGGGMIGGIEIPTVADAAKQLVAAAGQVAADLPKVDSFPRPEGAEIRFYILTPDGVRSGSATPDALESGRDRLSPLFIAANQLISGFRTHQAR